MVAKISVVPTSALPHKNLALLPGLSRELSNRCIPHEIGVTVPQEDLPAAPAIFALPSYELSELARTASRFDVGLVPSNHESYSYCVAEMQNAGVPLAASDIAVHREIRTYASLFDASDPRAAADAVLEAAMAAVVPSRSPASSTPTEYAATIWQLVDRIESRSD